jgi:hypothetical protein
LTAQTHEAAAYARNNRYYVNSSGHVVHSASCGEEKSFRHTAECRDGSTSFSEHHRAPARTTMESRIGTEWPAAGAGRLPSPRPRWPSVRIPFTSQTIAFIWFSACLKTAHMFRRLRAESAKMADQRLEMTASNVESRARSLGAEYFFCPPLAPRQQRPV